MIGLRIPTVRAKEVGKPRVFAKHQIASWKETTSYFPGNAMFVSVTTLGFQLVFVCVCVFVFFPHFGRISTFSF